VSINRIGSKGIKWDVQGMAVREFKGHSKDIQGMFIPLIRLNTKNKYMRGNKQGQILSTTPLILPLKSLYVPSTIPTELLN